MWLHAATQRNIAQLKADGVRVIDPAEGEMACGEFGPGRLPEPQDIVGAVADLLK
jgi:phosphopantothenoylcysteine decarboxylase/phosphopantothenate--cysteine ligase